MVQNSRQIWDYNSGTDETGIYFVPSEQLQDYCNTLVLIGTLDDFQKTANRIQKMLYEVTKLKPWKNSNLLSRLAANSLTVTRGMQQETYSDSWNLVRVYIGDSGSTTESIFPRRKQREQELRNWAPLAKWLDEKKEEKWWSHKTMHKKRCCFISH